MRRLTGPGVRLILLIWTAFIPFGWILPRSTLFEILNSLCVASCIGVLIAFWRSEWTLLAWPPRSWRAGDVLVLALGMLAFGLSLQFTELWALQIMGVTSVSNSLLSAFSRWVVASAATIILIAAGSEDGHVPPRAYRRAGIVAAVGIVTTLLMIVFAPPADGLRHDHSAGSNTEGP